MTARPATTTLTIEAQDLQVGDRLGAGRQRVARVHTLGTVLGGTVILAKVTTKGARSASVRRFAPTDPVTVRRAVEA